MARNLDYEGEIEILPGGYSSDKYSVAFTINFDLTPCRSGTRDDAPEYSEATVNSVHLRRNGEKVECPRWLEEIILDAVDEDVLIEHAMEDA